MSWLQKLYETYESQIRGAHGTTDIPLLPVSHTIQQAHIEVSIDSHGNFLNATVLPGRVNTVIPATEDSAGRTTNDAPHALSDKLQYIAGDYPRFGGEKNSYFRSYITQLKEWSLKQPHPSLAAVVSYVSKETVVADLVAAGCLHIDQQTKKLLTRPSVQPTPHIFRILQKKTDGSQDQGDAFIRWRIEIPGLPASATWEDKSLAESWMNFQLSQQSGAAICFVTAEARPAATKHPAKLRAGNDGAKLISSNDKNGYTFRGRFIEAEQVVAVGTEVTQKAHSALRWLIARQGWRNGSQAIVAWATSGEAIPQLLESSQAMFDDPDDEDTVESSSPTVQLSAGTATGDAGQAFAIRLRNRLGGYNEKLGDATSIVVMGLDSAVPGRMAVTYYRELTASEFLHRVEDWHTRYAWRQFIDFSQSYIGVMSPRDIAAAVFGSRIDDKLRRSTVERILPCIIDGRTIPYDMVASVVRRSGQRAGKSKGLDAVEWERTISVACSLYKGFHHERNYSMALENDRATRDYLYGRLLALADALENRALYYAKEKRETGAARLMQRFSDRPYSTWLLIEKGLQPYQNRLRSGQGGAFLKIVTELIDEVHHKFDPPEDYTSDKPLSGEYLLGYHCQRYDLRMAKAVVTTGKPVEDTNNDESEQ